MITDEEFRAARALCEAATPGPWRNQPHAPHLLWIDGSDDTRFDDPADAAFTAAARTLVPRLLDEVDRLRAENQNLRAALGEALKVWQRLVDAAEKRLSVPLATHAARIAELGKLVGQ